jgi:hypothetical protein
MLAAGKKFINLLADNKILAVIIRIFEFSDLRTVCHKKKDFCVVYQRRISLFSRHGK